MSEYVPDKWVVVKIEGPDIPLTYKVFACWYGGFLGSNSWKLNSGITKVTKDGKFYLFEGHSGSVYKCHEGLQGLHMYGTGVLGDIIRRAKEIKTVVELMPEDTNWLELDYNV
jgi:hypothetical protein